MAGAKSLPLVFSNELSDIAYSTSLLPPALGWGDDDFQIWGGSGVVRFGFLGGDELRGREGSDILIGLNGNDRLSGKDGNDLILAGSGHDRADGGRGHDAIALGTGNDTAWGGAGNDLVFGGRGLDVIDGGSGADLLFGGDGADVLRGGAGNDFIFGGEGDDVLHGGRGRDVMDAGEGADTLVVAPDSWHDSGDTDLLLSPVEDLLVFELGSDVEAIRFTASAFAHSAENTISGSLFTGAILFEDGDKTGDSDAEVLWEGSATDFEGAVTTTGLVDEFQVSTFADLFGRVPSDEFDVFGTLFITVEAENDQTYSYGTDFRGEQGDFAFEFVAPNGSSLAHFVWDETGFAIASETVLAKDDLAIV